MWPSYFQLTNLITLRQFLVWISSCKCCFRRHYEHVTVVQNNFQIHGSYESSRQHSTTVSATTVTTTATTTIIRVLYITLAFLHSLEFKPFFATIRYYKI
jgi:hypothetical protein